MEFESGTSATPPTEQQIKSFERDCRVQLPLDYVSMLKIGNGAVPLTNLFFQGARDRIIERMLCLLTDPNADDLHGDYDIDVVITQLDSRLVVDREARGLRIIPIASLFGGDFVCLDFRDDVTNPSVAAWDHELSTDYAPRLMHIARSFADFARLLQVA